MDQESQESVSGRSMEYTSSDGNPAAPAVISQGSSSPIQISSVGESQITTDESSVELFRPPRIERQYRDGSRAPLSRVASQSPSHGGIIASPRGRSLSGTLQAIDDNAANPNRSRSYSGTGGGSSTNEQLKVALWSDNTGGDQAKTYGPCRERSKSAMRNSENGPLAIIKDAVTQLHEGNPEGLSGDRPLPIANQPTTNNPRRRTAAIFKFVGAYTIG